MKRYGKLFQIMLLFICCIPGAMAQYVKISGKVTDMNGHPVSRATISLTMYRHLTMTDESGNYATIMNTAKDSTIRCTHANYKTSEQKIQGNRIVNFLLYTKETGYVLPLIVDSTNNADKTADADKRYIDSVLSENRIFTKVEMVPEFYGGEPALRAYYKVGLRLAKPAIRSGVNGIITVSFLLNKDGSVSNCKLLSGITKSIDDAVLKLTEQLPKWKPAMQNGKNCEFNYVLSIPIQLKLVD